MDSSEPSLPASSRGTGASKTEVCSTRSCRSSFPSTSFISGRWMLWTEQRNGSEWQDAWNRPACETGEYLSLHAVIVARQNRETHRCEARYSSGAARACGPAAPMNCVNPPLAGSRSSSAVILLPRFSPSQI